MCTRCSSAAPAARDAELAQEFATGLLDDDKVDVLTLVGIEVKVDGFLRPLGFTLAVELNLEVFEDFVVHFGEVEGNLFDEAVAINAKTIIGQKVGADFGTLSLDDLLHQSFGLLSRDLG